MDNNQEQDPFDIINNVQNQYYTQGYQRAKNDKELDANAEKKQNYNQGLMTGKQLGLELGYYFGYLEELKPILFMIDEYSKHQSKVDQLFEEIQQIVMSINPEEGNVILDELPNTVLILRNKFKTLLLSLGLKKPDFNFNSSQNNNQIAQNTDSFDF